MRVDVLVNAQLLTLAMKISMRINAGSKSSKQARLNVTKTSIGAQMAKAASTNVFLVTPKKTYALRALKTVRHVNHHLIDVMFAKTVST